MADLQLTRRRALLLVAGALVALLLATRFVHHPHPAALPGPVAPAAATRAATVVVVNVVGAVRKPGVYRLRDGDRVADALAKAGGAARKADLAAVNLAAPLADGQQVVIPRHGSPGAAATPGATAPSGPVHLNTATLEQLDTLPGVGPVTAQKILDYRTKHGAFASVDELDAIAGIGPARLDSLRDLVAP